MSKPIGIVSDVVNTNREEVNASLAVMLNENKNKRTYDIGVLNKAIYEFDPNNSIEIRIVEED